MPTVKEKYGYLPTSVWSLKKGSALRLLVGDEHGAGLRRSKDAKYLPGLKMSSFNPDLAKRVIEYWSEEGDTVLDPFAGHSTRMLVAKLCNRNYIGFEIGPVAKAMLLERLENRPLALGERSDVEVDVRRGDGCELQGIPDESVDLIFTCPPFWDIEKYESVPGQLSDCKTYPDFLERLTGCAVRCFDVLKEGKFMTWVVADFRRDGFKVFHSDILGIFRRSGFEPWDIVINVLQSPFAWAQIGKCEAHKYTSKVHEYIVVVRKPLGGRNDQ